VGFNDDPGAATFVESWNGSEWSIVPSPTPSGDTAYLDSVSCIATDNCTAVGSSNNGTVTLVESWNGTAWSIVSSPNPSGALSTLNGISCLSSSYCTAVGSSSPSANPPAPQTLVETWNGTDWALTPSPDVEGSSNNTLAALACLDSVGCTAVGYDGNGNIDDQSNLSSQPLVEVGPPVAVSLGITTRALPAASVGVAYSTILSATGGNLPYTWKMVSGRLPKGLRLSRTTGVISGTPSRHSVSTTFIVEVLDTKAGKPKTRDTAEATFTLNVS
jgi:hypothetical protein